jgi:hypothetical protein
MIINKDINRSNKVVLKPKIALKIISCNGKILNLLKNKEKEINILPRDKIILYK